MTGPRYLAATGEGEGLRRWLSALVPPRHSPQRLNRVMDTEDLVVFASPETPLLPLAEDKGLLIGRLFRGRDSCEPVAALTLSESRHAAWSRGRSLMESTWGGFVAFLRDSEAVTAIRDPSGSVPVHHRDERGIHIYFSHFELVEGLGLGWPGIDETFLRQWLTYPFLRTARTGIEGFTEVLPGTGRTTGRGAAVVETIWTPWRAAAPEKQVQDFEEAARRLRDVALATVPVQLAAIQNPVLELSGGLDSSIVAACLSQSGCSFRAANFVTILPDGDERHYARRVAEAVGFELAELREDELPLDLSPPKRRTLRPGLSPVLQPLRRALARHARQTGAGDFVTGAGGDNLFCYLTTTAPILDASSTLGLRAAAATLQDVATLGECTIWRAGRLALRKRVRQKKRPAWKEDRRFLAPAGIADQPDLHPWLDRPPGALPGKIEHVESLVRVQHFLEPQYPSGETIHHPLLNQPLTELCLAIPSWLWVRGGRNRAVARAAFADLLPAEIVRRRTKGRLESMCARAYSANRVKLAELLLDGELRKRRLLDAAQVGAYLRIDGRPPDDGFYRVFDLVAVLDPSIRR
jgi:asparagine synthase (glutamine-hydrolysing)